MSNCIVGRQLDFTNLKMWEIAIFLVALRLRADSLRGLPKSGIESLIGGK